MNKVLAAELYKLRHSKMMWLVWTGGLLPAVLYAVSGLFSTNTASWEVWFYNQFSVLLIFSPPLFAMVTGYIIGREYRLNTINALLTYPYSRLQILSGKMIIAGSLIALTCMLAFGANMLTGLAAAGPVDAAVLLTYFRTYLVLTAVLVSIVPLWTLMCMLGKSYTPAIVVSLIIICLPGPIGGGDAYGKLVQFVLQLAGQGDPVNAGLFFGLLGSLFLVFLLLSAIAFARSDVHGGA